MASILDEYEDSLSRAACLPPGRASVGIPHSGKVPPEAAAAGVGPLLGALGGEAEGARRAGPQAPAGTRGSHPSRAVLPVQGGPRAPRSQVPGAPSHRRGAVGQRIRAGPTSGLQCAGSCEALMWVLYHDFVAYSLFYGAVNHRGAWRVTAYDSCTSV